MPRIQPRLLIIDDEMESVALLLSFLEGQRLDLRVALDGEDGLRKAIKARPDAILLDVRMPGLDGYEVCRRLKSAQQTADVPVIFLSGNSSLEDKLEGFAAGGVDYVCKPFRAEEVLARIFVHLRLQRRLAQQDASAGEFGIESSRRVSAPDPLVDVVSLMQQVEGDWPGLAELARQVGTNEKRLTELFRQRFGMPVFEYLVELRLAKARHLLESSELAIKRIADHAGYSNASAFTRAFRRRFALGPKEYRQTRRHLIAAERL